ncbi:ABC transporter permease [Sediminibacter sp. Hel_I_10]|uniref:ABC transporter permease n=1 Tax=Sediminibacter sp. Hel_I_10 TaxID=1392490 RepID=UPI000478A7E2|nr:ABC transporter permease [Sediminibacter sp. Hel_I_10]
MIKNYLKIAWRNIFKYKLTAIINILGLALGLTSCLIILVFVDYELSFDEQHSYSNQTYRVVQQQDFPEDTYYFNTTPFPLADAIRTEIPKVERVTQIAGLTSETLSVENISGIKSVYEESDVLYADADFFKVFDGVKWLAGNKADATQDLNSVVLTERLAKKYFNQGALNYESIINSTILLNNEELLSVKGIVENPAGNSSYKFGMVLPYRLFKKRNEGFAGNWSATHIGTTFVVLGEPSKISKTELAINKMSKNYLDEIHAKRVSYKLQALIEIHTDSLYGSGPGGYIMPKKILMISATVAIFILLIAIANFINLVTAQSVLRSKEVGVLKALGSSRFKLVIRFVIENTMLVLLSLGLSFVLVHLSLLELNAFFSIISLDLVLGSNFVYMLIIAGLLTALIATVYPALVLSKINPIQALKSKELNSLKGVNTRKALITFQFIIVQVFVIAVIVVGLQMNYFNTKDVGFEKDSIVITPVPEFDKIDVFKNKLNAIADIESVSFGSGPPMGIDGLSLGTSFRLASENQENGMYSEMKIGDENYLNLYDLKLLAGRNFKTTKKTFDQFVVNEALIKTYNWTPQEAIGKQLTINEGEGTIVGVVSDYHNNALQYEITPSIIINWNSFQMNAFMKLSSANPGVIVDIENAWKSSFKKSFFEYGFLSEAIEREYAVQSMIYLGFKILSLLSICIGGLGLLGLMTFVLLSKSKEIAIRNVLGSSTSQIVMLLSKEYTTLILVAFVIAAPITYYLMFSWLKDFTYQIELSVWMFVTGGLFTFIIAFVACSFQSIKMALVKPIKYLRTE